MTNSDKTSVLVGRDWKIDIRPAATTSPDSLVTSIEGANAMYDDGKWISISASNPASGRKALREYTQMSATNELRTRLGDLRVVIPNRNGATVALRDVIEALLEIQFEQAGILE